MRKLLISLLFLLLFSTFAKADPFTQMIKGGIKGGLKGGSGGSKSYEKVLFNKNIGNYGNNIKVTKKYDSFYGKTSCNLEKPRQLRFFDERNENYALIFWGTFSENYSPRMAFKFDNNLHLIKFND